MKNQWLYKPAFSPDGTKVAVSILLPVTLKENDPKAKAHDGNQVHTCKKMVILNANDFSLVAELGSEVFPLWSPTSKYICATDFSRTPVTSHACTDLSVFDASTGARLLSIKDVQPPAYAWSPDGSRLAFAHGEAIGILDIETKQETFLVVRDNETNFMVPRWSPDSKFIAARFRQKLVENAKAESPSIEHNDKQKRAIKIWNVDSKEEKAKVNAEVGMGMFSWSPNGKLFIYREPLAIHVLDAATMEAIKTIKTRNTETANFYWSHGKTKFLYQDGSVIHILNAATMKETARTTTPAGEYFDLEWLANDNFILISASNTAAICDAKSGNYIGYKTWSGAISYTLSPDQKVLFIQNINGVTENEPITLPPAHGESPFKDGKTGEPSWDGQN